MPTQTKIVKMENNVVLLLVLFCGSFALFNTLGYLYIFGVTLGMVVGRQLNVLWLVWNLITR